MLKLKPTGCVHVPVLKDARSWSGQLVGLIGLSGNDDHHEIRPVDTFIAITINLDFLQKMRLQLSQADWLYPRNAYCKRTLREHIETVAMVCIGVCCFL